MIEVHELQVELRAKLFNLRETRPASHIYLMFDNARPVAAAHPLHPDQLAARPIKRQRVALPSAGLAPEDAQWSPFLLQFYCAGENGYADEDLLDLALETAGAQCASVNGCYVVGWVASELEPDALAAHLRSGCAVFDSAQARRRQMPLYEPHRMALLLDEPDAQPFIRHFLRATHLWAFIDSAGRLRSVTFPEGTRAVDHQAGARAPGLAMCRAQSRVPLARLALLGLVKAGVDIPAHVERRIDTLLVSAAAQGLAHDEDVVFFVLNGFTLQDRWFEHPEARRCIHLSRTESAPLCGLMAELPDEVLDEIGQHGASA